MTQILQYKCPICAFNLPLSNFIEKHSENFIELGFISTRECRGKKGMPTIDIKSLVDYSETEIGKKAIEKLKHDSLGLIHALEKQGIVSAEDFKFKLGLVPKSKEKDKNRLNKTDRKLQATISDIKNKISEYAEEKESLLEFTERLKDKIRQLKNDNTELSNALLDASGQIQELQNQATENSNEEFIGEIQRLRGIIEDYENAALSS